MIRSRHLSIINWRDVCVCVSMAWGSMCTWMQLSFQARRVQIYSWDQRRELAMQMLGNKHEYSETQVILIIEPSPSSSLRDLYLNKKVPKGIILVELYLKVLILQLKLVFIKLVNSSLLIYTGWLFLTSMKNQLSNLQVLTG